MAFEFFPQALNALLASPVVQNRLLVANQPELLRQAKENCSVPWPRGTLNPAPGTVHGDTGVYMRSEVFRDTLELRVIGDEMSFFSPAVAYRRRSGAFPYGQALIEGRAPFIGPYRLLPPEFYTQP